MGEIKRRNDICTQLVLLAERMDADNAKLRQVTELSVQARSFPPASAPSLAVSLCSSCAMLANLRPVAHFALFARGP